MREIGKIGEMREKLPIHPSTHPPIHPFFILSPAFPCRLEVREEEAQAVAGILPEESPGFRKTEPAG
jgi:hypothetical protein